MSQWAFPLPEGSCPGLPIGTHPGAFGVKRRVSHHTGIDLYCPEGTPVGAVEDGQIIGWEKFTGPQDNSPWWLDTDAVLVEGASGVICYGEIEVRAEIKSGELQTLKRGDLVGSVKPVVPKGRERPDIPGHSRSMLHVELYKPGQKQASVRWELAQPKHDYLLNPTPYLSASIGSPTKCLQMAQEVKSLECADLSSLQALSPLKRVVCAFYTRDTPYEAEIEHLRSSLIKFHIPYFFKGLPNLGKWQLNCGQKPTFIKDCLQRFAGCVVMYTDADSVLLREPKYLETFNADLAIHRLGGRELLSGTMVWNSNPKTLALLDRWIEAVRLAPEDRHGGDQLILDGVLSIPEAIKGLNIVSLPLEYIQIFDHPNQSENPVVIHNQASRRFKNTGVLGTS